MLGSAIVCMFMQVAVHFNRPAQQLLISNVTLSDNRIGLAVLPACEDLSDESSPYHNPQQEGRVPPQRSGPLQLAASAPATGSRRCSIAVSDAVLIGSSDNAACSKACNAEAADRQLPDPLAADAEGGCGTRYACRHTDEILHSAVCCCIASWTIFSRWTLVRMAVVLTVLLPKTACCQSLEHNGLLLG